tara:strand:+ start:975 stop:1463 length:489 start_codon:yes stop_codon:yes gene_type:complete
MTCRCGSSYIVNKTHNLCYDCNQVRLHGEKWKKKRLSKALSSKKFLSYKDKKKVSKKGLKQVSETNSYFSSDGTRYSRSEVDKKIKNAKKEIIQEQLDEFGYNFCVDCKINANAGVSIDCSHTKSVSDCINDGVLELAWYKPNIKPRCRDCHNKIDGNDVRL